MIRSHGCQLTGGSYWGAIMPLLHQSLTIKPDPTILVQSGLKYYCRTKPSLAPTGPPRKMHPD